MKSKVPKGIARGNETLDGILPPGYPFYTFDESTYPLVSLTRYAMRFREFRHLWRHHHGDFASESDLLAQSDGYEKSFNWLHESRLMRVIAGLLGTKQPAAAFQCISDGLKAYEEGFMDHSNKDQAKIHLILACEILWDEGYERSGVTKAQLRARACHLWAESVCRRKNHPSTNIAIEQANLPHVDWPLIFRELGLEDIRASKPGRKPIGNRRG
jgi:hypothetical protein